MAKKKTIESWNTHTPQPFAAWLICWAPALFRITMELSTQPSTEGTDMEEIEKLRSDIDMLMGRSLAQESMLLFLSKRELAGEFFLDVDMEQTAKRMRESLRHSPLTDAQIAHFEREIRTLLERLRHMAAQPDQESSDTPLF